MEQMVDRLSQKIHTLTSAQLVEVEHFVESLQSSDRDRERELTRAWARASEPAFEAVWNNPEDEVYDHL